MGGQIYIDGFTGGRLPPKLQFAKFASTRIRFRRNMIAWLWPIEILTKPGTDKFRGQGFFTFNDESLNSRNPFAPDSSAVSTENYGGNLSGPISKKKPRFPRF